ncbi:MAG: hypothetical protein HOH43_25260 [Candidatus Latescibacteria bacterium]|jgi:hypothetical protein|nr:hypothetical protein [Candidatus Latescibacterota bacterium]
MSDRLILRELAKQVAEIAALPVQQEAIDLWKAVNDLKPVRPMVMIDQIPWHEMEVEDELALKSHDLFCRSLETNLRRTLYRWKHMRADMVIEPVVEVGKVILGMDFGLERVEERAVTDPENDVVSHYYIDQLETEEDLEKIRSPKITLDEDATRVREDQARDLFDGILDVKMQGCLPSFAIWDRITEWHGAENVLWDLADRPDHLHAIMSRLTAANHDMLDQLETLGLLGYGQTSVHCTGAYTDELPADGFDVNCPQAKDLWTHGMAQIFSSVSPTMHQEFELDYATTWYERFGLGYYGCCEPLHEKIDLVARLPGVRKISMSPWVDVARGAEAMGSGFVFSRKPSPAFLAGDRWEPEAVRRDLSDTADHCERNGCPLEFILKDISTVEYQPQRLWEWVDTAMGVARNGT